MKALLFSLFTFCAVASHASAKAYFQTKKEMIENAEVIAVITIGEVKDLPKDHIQDFFRSGTAKLEMLIKGEIAQSFTIFGNENFRCAHCSIEPGRYLAFLNKTGDGWCGANWQYSLRPISGDQVEWYVHDEDRHDMKPADLKAVIAEIRTAIESKPEHTPKP